jgi:hypothetical protein
MFLSTWNWIIIKVRLDMRNALLKLVQVKVTAAQAQTLKQNH